MYPLTVREAADDIGLKIELAKRTEFDFVDEVLYHKGRSDAHRSESVSFDREIVNVIIKNMSGYRSTPRPAYRKGMKMLHKHRGELYIHESRWSLRAIKSFWRALRYSDGFDPVTLVTLLSLLFGAAGYWVASEVYELLLYASPVAGQRRSPREVD